MNEYRNIDNPLNVKIEKKEIYSCIFEYRIPDGFYFESCGVSYGNRIYASNNFTNYYIIKKKDEKGTTEG